MRCKLLPLAAALASTTMGFGASQTLGQDSGSTGDASLELIRIIGSPDVARRLPGSGAVIDQEQMRIEAATDINQLIKTIPGTYVREEDGLGLRPNIGIRAASSGRSGKVTLMEDGVLFAPAPYSNPAAYYFPTTLRMSSVEVLKGAPLLRHGPQTTGGVINLVSTPIPEQNGGSIMAMAGEFNTREVHGYYGGRSGNFGWLVETAQRDSDGYKNIDRSNRDTGYDIQDYVAKLNWRDDRQSLLLKLQYSEETSNETYLGLTDADFRRSPNRRYGMSEIDQMNNRHKGVNLTYNLALNDQFSASATAYYNDYFRDWFKLSGGKSFINAANAGDMEAREILEGLRDVEGLNYKHNSRSYKSYGVQFNLAAELGLHQFDAGFRVHDDEMDRFQPTEIYDQVNGSLVFQEIVSPSGGNNRFETGEALSLWVTDTWQLTDAFNLNLALRYEDVETSRLQFDDAQRNILGGRRGHDNGELLPGASFTYDVNDNWQLLAGVHRGFSPLGGGAKDNQEPETSINYEYGARFSQDALFLEFIGFYSDFENQAENCSVGRPCSNGATAGTFVTGEASVSGLEVQAGAAFTAGNWRIPVNLAYTYTSAEITQDNPVSGFQDGDLLADVPENTFSLRVAMQNNNWHNYAVAKYIDRMCFNTGCNRTGDAFSETDSLFVVDVVSRYALNPSAEVFVKVENLFDEQKIISRAPDGPRPNKPRAALVGIEYSF